jgi:hypothetical protein
MLRRVPEAPVIIAHIQKINDRPTWPANSVSGHSLFQVLRAILTLRPRLPLRPDKPIVTEPAGTSHSCRSRGRALRSATQLTGYRKAELSSREVVRQLQSYHQRRLAMELILIVVVLVLLFGGGGYYGRRRGHW